MIEAFLAVTIWGLSFSLTKMALGGFQPSELVFIRLVLAAITVTVIYRLRSGAWPDFKSNLEGGLITGVFEFSLTYFLYTYSLKFLPSGVVGVLTLVTPALTLLIALLLKSEALTPLKGWAVALAVVGSLFCVPENSFTQDFFIRLRMQPSAGVWLGLLLIMMSNLSFAYGNVAINRIAVGRGWQDGSTTAVGLWIGAGVALVVYLIFPKTPVSQLYLLKIWWLPVYLGVVATGFGYFLWNRGVEKTSATIASVVGNLKAPMSLFWGAALLNEPLSWKIIVGVAILFVSQALIFKERNIS